MHLSLSNFFPGCFSSASRCRASTSPWNGLRDLGRSGFISFVTQSYRRWFGLLAALAIVSSVAALRRSLGGAMPASTGKLSTGVARRQPLMVRKAVLRQVGVHAVFDSGCSAPVLVHSIRRVR